MASEISDLGIVLGNWWYVSHQSIETQSSEEQKIWSKIRQLKYIAQELEKFGQRLDQWR
jgi:hypothetical protein